MAPDIVAAINHRKDAAEIWNRVYDELVQPCVQMIHNGQDEEAYRLYKAYTLSLTNAMGGMTYETHAPQKTQFENSTRYNKS